MLVVCVTFFFSPCLANFGRVWGRSLRMGFLQVGLVWLNTLCGKSIRHCLLIHLLTDRSGSPRVHLSVGICPTEIKSCKGKSVWRDERESQHLPPDTFPSVPGRRVKGLGFSSGAIGSLVLRGVFWFYPWGNPFSQELDDGNVWISQWQCRKPGPRYHRYHFCIQHLSTQHPVWCFERK